jgi:predicted metal-dependent hydrolase
MLDSADFKLNESKRTLNSIVNPDADIVPMIAQLNRSIDDIAGLVTEQQGWLKQYFSKGKIGRVLMFSK